MMKTTARIIALFFFLVQSALIFALNITQAPTSVSDVFDTFAQDENAGSSTFLSLNIPTGARAESLGGAYTGLSDDISFFDYNPAGSALLSETEAAVFHNSWISDSAIETIAATTRYGDFGMAAAAKCFYVPFTQYDYYGEKQTDGYYSETTAIFNMSYNFFHGYYFKGIALGMNIKGAWRSVPDYADSETSEIKKGISQSAAAVMADFGALTRFNFLKFYSSREPNFSIGLCLKNAGVAFTGFSKQIERDDPIATQASIGFSYKMLEAFTLSADFSQPINLFSPSESEKFSAGAGMMFQITYKTAILAGFLLKGGNPRMSLGGEAVYRGVQFNINYTLDLTSSLNPVNHISLSAKIRLGDRGRAKKAATVDEKYIEGLQKYSEGDYTEAIRLWKEALEIDSGFDPAKKGITIAQKQQQLIEKIKEMQSLD